MARESKPLRCFIDVDHEDFVKPGNMPRRVRLHCERSGQYVPQTPGEVIRCIDESLALKYRYAVECIEDCTGLTYNTINILGGGTKSRLLCQMTADAGGRTVVAGPDEATVYGNVAVQYMAQGKLKDMREIRRVVQNSCELDTYRPQDMQEWEKVYRQFRDKIIGE